MTLYFRNVTVLLVAMCLVATWGVVVTAQSAEELRARAEAGNAVAQFNLGFMYATGRGIPQNDTEAVRWYRRSAIQSFALAQAGLGHMYFSGRGVPQNDDEAARWYRRAAEQDYVAGRNNLEEMYAEGRAVP